MDYEKEYKDALERAKYLKENTDSVGAKDISYLFEYIFPVLKESEEEKIKNRLIEFISCNPGVISDLDEEKALSWLEKQCEQKQDFNYHDYVCRDAAIRYLESIKSPHDVARQHKEEVIDWLNSLEKRIQPQHKQEWSEEDSRILYNVKAFIGYAAGQRGVKDELFKEANEWLNSLPIGFVHNENYNEDMVTLLIDELKQIANRNNAPEQYKMEIDWLKSLRPQLKQEWSEDDEKMLVSFLHKVEVCDLLSNKEIAWIRKKLKSVKPPFHWKPSEVKNETKNECPNYSEGYGCSTSPLKQCDTCPDYKLYNHWKPSKEQMEIVENLLACEMPPRHKKIFESLYNDLKNLRS